MKSRPIASRTFSAQTTRLVRQYESVKASGSSATMTSAARYHQGRATRANTRSRFELDIFFAFFGDQPGRPHRKHHEEQREHDDVDQSRRQELGRVALD